MKRPKREIQKRPLAVVMAALPPLAFVRVPSSNETVIVKRGEEGHWPLPLGKLPKVKPGEDQTDAAALNAAIGVTPAQASAMLAGSMFGFHVPAADPVNCEPTQHAGDGLCSYPDCKCIVSTSTSKPEPVCPLGLAQ